MNKTKLSLLILLFIATHILSKAQLVNGCGFMQQNRLEVGVANNGAYGTPEDAPTGYHTNNNPVFATVFNPATGTYLMRPNALGFVADYDTNGWNIGTPPYFGDYFLPGTPQEGWSVEVNGVRCDAFSNEFQLNATTGFTGGLTGTNQSVNTTAPVTSSIWEGNVGALNIKQTTTLKRDKLYFTGHVKFKNTGATTLQNVYYMRTLDPDNDVSTTGNFNTINDLTYQMPNSEKKTLIGALSTIDTNAYLGLGTIDCRSKGFICNFGLFPPTDSLSYLYSGHPDLTYTGTITQDVGVGLVYNLGDIAPGDSTELYFTYILRKSSLDEALDEIKPQYFNNGNLYGANDTIYACANTVVPVSIVNGSSLNWIWTSTAPLSNTSGTSNNITFGNTAVQVTAIGTGICNDTISFYLDVTNTIISTINASICNGTGYTYNGVTYTLSGIYNDTVSTSSSCDTIVTLNLNAGLNTSDSISVRLCGATQVYNFNGNTYSLTGIYFDTLINSVGCDSLVILDLIVGSNSSSTINVQICQGQTYFFNGSLLNSTGIYTSLITNSSGCDSIIILNLTVTVVDINVTQTGIILQANASGATYQWIDCNTNLPIVGATNQTYTPIIDGLYAAIISYGACGDTSSCYLAIGVGVEEVDNISPLRITPNPFMNELTLELGEEIDNANLLIYNSLGQTMFEQNNMQGKRFTINTTQFSSGIYLLRVVNGSKIYSLKIAK